MAFLKDHLKSFVAVILCFTLIFSSFALAFADSEEEAVTSSEEASSEALPSSALLATVTDEDEIALDNAMRELSVKLAATSSEYTATDIYNLLLSFRIFYNGTAQVKVYNQSVLDEINSMEDWLQTYLLNINGDLHYVSGGVSYSAAELLLMIVRALGTYDSSQPDLLGSVAMISGYLSNIDSDSSQIHTDLSNINQLIGLFRLDFESHFSNLTRVLNNGFDDVVDSVNVFADDNHTDLTSIDTSISDFADDMNNIEWTSGGASLLGVSSTLEKALASDYDLDSTFNTSDCFYVFNISNKPLFLLYFGNALIRSSSFDVEFYNFAGHITNSVYAILNDEYFSSLYFIQPTPVGWSGGNIVIIRFSSSSSFRVAHSVSSYYISERNSDYFTVSDFIMSYQDLDLSKHDSDIMDKFEYLYASDDLIEAKDAQQAQEDAALEEFTGGGSAAASVNDIGSAKDVSSGLKNGLSSGGSASAPIGVMQSNSGFWDWFSSETMGNLDNTQNNRSLRSSGGEEYIDFYSRNWEQIQDYLGGNR